MPNVYDLFLDESGNFMENSPDPSEQSQSRGQRRFPSQIAGILAPRGDLTRGAAQSILDQLATVLGRPLTHSVDHRGPIFSRLVSTLLDLLAERRWQPVRLANEEGVSFGVRSAYYLNMVAEIVIQVCAQKLREGQRKSTFILFLPA